MGGDKTTVGDIGAGAIAAVGTGASVTVIQQLAAAFRPGSVPVFSRPFQAPPEAPYFVGRREEIVWLEEEVDKGSRMIGLCGLGGVGKTALAIHVAHTLKDKFEDGVLWAQLDATTPEAVLQSFATEFGQDKAAGELPNLADKAAKVRSILADKHVLVVLDNAEKSEQIEWLIPTGERNVTLITTRNQKMLDVLGANLLKIKPFDEAGGLALLNRVLGQARVSAELEAARQVIELVGGLPLALSIVAGYLAETDDLTIAEYNDLLIDERMRLEHLVDWEDTRKDVAASFELSYKCLPEAIQRLFASLSVFDGSDFSVQAAAAAVDMPIVMAKQGLGVC